MTWTRLSDDFTDRPQLLQVSRSARLLHIEAMVWSNRLLTDGRIPSAALRRMTDAEDLAELVEELASAGIWEATDDGQWELDWKDQESAAEVKGRRDYRQETQKRYRERHSKHERGDHSMCDPRFCKKAVTGNATGNAISNKTGYETPSRPVPSPYRDRDRRGGAPLELRPRRRTTPRSASASRATHRPLTAAPSPTGHSIRSTRRRHEDTTRPTRAEIQDLRRRLARLMAKHRRFAETTNALLTEQLGEIARLREEAS
jgi:hypothetical protein